MTTNEGGPAFPTNDPYSQGMSLRDWFAGQALIGLLAANGEFHDEYISHLAFSIAAAMLDARGTNANDNIARIKAPPGKYAHLGRNVE